MENLNEKLKQIEQGKDNITKEVLDYLREKYLYHLQVDYIQKEIIDIIKITQKKLLLEVIELVKERIKELDKKYKHTDFNLGRINALKDLLGLKWKRKKKK